MDKASGQGATFLEKFKGKTSVIGKRGISDLFQNGNGQQRNEPPLTQHSQGQSRRPSVLKERSISRPAELPKVLDLDTVLPPLRKLEPLQTGRSRLLDQQTRENSKEPSRERYVPSFVVSKSSNIVSHTKQQPGHAEVLSTPQTTRTSLKHRDQLSRYNDYSLEKTVLANNTKVYEDAFRHLEFLNMVENRMKGGNR